MRQELKRGNISTVILNACRRRQAVKNPALLITGSFRRLRLLRMTLLVSFLILHFTFLIPTTSAQTCRTSCPSGQTSTGTCAIDIEGTSCDGGPCLEQSCGTGEIPTSCTISQSGVYCGTAPSPAPAPSTTGGSGTTVTLDNPLGTADFRIIVGNIIKTLTGGAGMLALLMFIYGGFTWLTSGGNSEKIQKGRDILVWSTAGMVVMFSSYFIVRFIILGITRGIVAP